MPGPVVFVSYSREDVTFTDQLIAALEALEFSPAIDRIGIHGAEKWQERLTQLILDADAIIFVLSPASARSEVCNWEVEQAINLNKRIIPVLAQPLANATPHPALTELNYIFMYADEDFPDSGFGVGLAALNKTLQVDIDWTREHTRLGGIAMRWQARGRPADSLVRGSELTQWQAWRDNRPINAPELTALQKEILQSSEQAQALRRSETKKQLEQRTEALEQLEQAQVEKQRTLEVLSRRTHSFVLFGLAVIAVGALISAFAYDQSREAQEATAELKATNEAFIESTYDFYSSALKRISLAVTAQTWPETLIARHELKSGDLTTEAGREKLNPEIESKLSELLKHLEDESDQGKNQGKITLSQRNELSNLVLALSQACRAHWRKTNPQFQNLQRQIYLEAKAVTSTIKVLAQGEIDSDSVNFYESLDRFWQLYFGSLALVESEPVAGAMVKIGRILKVIDRSSVVNLATTEIAAHIDNLHDRINQELLM